MSFWLWCKECLQGQWDCGVREVIGGELAVVLTVVYVVSGGIATVYFLGVCTCTGSVCEGEHVYLHSEGDHVYLANYVREIMCTCTGSMREIMCTFTGRECEGDHVYLHREHV